MQSTTNNWKKGKIGNNEQINTHKMKSLKTNQERSGWCCLILWYWARWIEKSRDKKEIMNSNKVVTSPSTSIKIKIVCLFHVHALTASSRTLHILLMLPCTVHQPLEGILYCSWTKNHTHIINGAFCCPCVFIGMYSVVRSWQFKSFSSAGWVSDKRHPCKLLWNYYEWKAGAPP